MSDDDDEVDGVGGSDAVHENNEFQPDGLPVVQLVTRRENGYTFLEASPVVEVDAMEIVFRSEWPLLRIAGLATFGRGEVRAGLVRFARIRQDLGNGGLIAGARSPSRTGCRGKSPGGGQRDPPNL